MIKWNETNSGVKDNECILNGKTFMVSDSVYRKIVALAQNGIGEEVRWEVKEEKTIKGERVYVIYSSTHTLRSSANAILKSVKGINTYDVVSNSPKNKKGYYTAWGYPKKADADKVINTLPTYIEE